MNRTAIILSTWIAILSSLLSPLYVLRRSTKNSTYCTTHAAPETLESKKDYVRNIRKIRIDLQIG